MLYFPNEDVQFPTSFSDRQSSCCFKQTVPREVGPRASNFNKTSLGSAGEVWPVRECRSQKSGSSPPTASRREYTPRPGRHGNCLGLCRVPGPAKPPENILVANLPGGTSSPRLSAMDRNSVKTAGGASFSHCFGSLPCRPWFFKKFLTMFVSKMLTVLVPFVVSLAVHKLLFS